MAAAYQLYVATPRKCVLSALPASLETLELEGNQLDEFDVARCVRLRRGRADRLVKDRQAGTKDGHRRRLVFLGHAGP